MGQLTTPMRNFLVPQVTQVTQVARVARRPFFMVTTCTLHGTHCRTRRAVEVGARGGGRRMPPVCSESQDKPDSPCNRGPCPSPRATKQPGGIDETPHRFA